MLIEKRSIHDEFNILTGNFESFDYSNPKWCFGGKGGGGSQNSTVTQTSNPPPYVAAAYQDLLAKANQVAATPYTPYSGNIVAPFTTDQTNAMNTVASQAGSTQPYTNAGVAAANAGSQSIWPNITQPTAANINSFMSPYNDDVIKATLANINENNAEQQNSLKGQAIASGASPFGGDRAGVAAAELARQQGLATNQTIAGLENQNYTQALNELNAQQQLQANTQASDAWRQLSAAQLYPQLGTNAQTNALTQASAQLQSGALQQQLGQEQLNVPYEQFLAQQAYPFQTTQFLGGLTEGIGSGSGGTSSTTSPGPSTASQLGGLGLTGFALNQALPQGYGIMSGLSSLGSFLGLKRGGIAGVRQKFDFGGIIPNVPDVSVSIVPTASTMRSGNGPPSAPSPGQQQPDSAATSLKNGADIGKLLASLAGNGGSSSGDGATGGLADIFSSNAGGFFGGDTAMASQAGNDASFLRHGMGGSPFGINFRKGGVAHYDIGGITNQNIQIQSPQTQAAYSQYANLPVEKLQQLAVMQPNNPMIQKALQMKRMGASSVPVAQGVAGAIPQANVGMASGGVRRYDNGGYVNDIGARTDVSFDDLLNALPRGVTPDARGPTVTYSSSDAPPVPQRKPSIPKKTKGLWIGESEPDFSKGGVAKYATDGYIDSDPSEQVLQDIAENSPVSANNAKPSGVASVNASDLLPLDAQGIALPAKSTDIPTPMPSSTETGSDLDSQPVVDHSGDTVKVHYPSEGKSVDTGIPSMKDSTTASSAWLPLLSAGLAIMGGKSPHALTNIGEGGLQGLKTLEEQRAAALNESKAQVEQQKIADDMAARRQEMAQTASRDAANAAYQKGELGIRQATLEQGKYVPVKNPLTGEQSVFNAKTGQWITTPMKGMGGLPMVDPDTGDIIPGGTQPTPTNANPQKSTFGFDTSNVTPNVYNALVKEDSKQRQAYMSNRPVAENVNRILDNLEPNLKLVDTGGILNKGYATAAQTLNPTGQTSTAASNIDKGTNDLATELNKFQYMPGARGSVLGLQTILNSKPGMQYPPQTNANIVAGIRAKTNSYLLEQELAQKYREASPLKVTDENTYTLDTALKTLYPPETVDPSNGNVTYNKQNVAKYRAAIPDAIAHPQKYIDAATNGTPLTSSTPSAGGTAIPPINQRVKGQEYTNPNGHKAVWTGTGWATP
jgi:hypothetical protein